MTEKSKTDKVKLKCCMDTKADKICANNCPNTKKQSIQLIVIDYYFKKDKSNLP